MVFYKNRQQEKLQIVSANLVFMKILVLKYVTKPSRNHFIQTQRTSLVCDCHCNYYEKVTEMKSTCLAVQICLDSHCNIGICRSNQLCSPVQYTIIQLQSEAILSKSQLTQLSVVGWNNYYTPISFISVWREQRWRHCAPYVWAASPGDQQSSRGSCWSPPPAELSGGSCSPSWSRCRSPRWRGRSRAKPDVWCSLFRGSLDPTKSPTPPEHPGCPAPSAKVLTGRCGWECPPGHCHQLEQEEQRSLDWYKMIFC